MRSRGERENGAHPATGLFLADTPTRHTSLQPISSKQRTTPAACAGRAFPASGRRWRPAFPRGGATWPAHACLFLSHLWLAVESLAGIWESAARRVRRALFPTTLFPLKIMLTLGVRLAWLSCPAVGQSEGARGPHTRACAPRNQRLSRPWASPRPDHPATFAEAGKPAAPRPAPVPGSTRSGAHAAPVPPAQLTVARLPPSLPGYPG